MGSSSDAALDFADDLGTTLSCQHRFEEAKTLLRMSLEGAENKLGFNDVLTLKMVCSLSHVMAEEGLFEEAEKNFRRSLEAHETSNVF